MSEASLHSLYWKLTKLRNTLYSPPKDGGSGTLRFDKAKLTVRQTIHNVHFLAIRVGKDQEIGVKDIHLDNRIIEMHFLSNHTLSSGGH